MIIRNLGRATTARLHRVTRPGNRSAFFFNGMQLKRSRPVEVPTEEALKCIDDLIEGVELGYIEVKDDDEQILTADMLRKFAGQPPKGDEVSEPVQEPEDSADSDDSEDEPDADQEPEDEREEWDEEELSKMKRSELDDLAAEHGLDPADYSNKGEVIDALMNLEG